MSTVIQFPRKRPLEAHELPAEWSRALKMHYVHMTYAGLYTHQEAFESCQFDHDQRQREGETHDEYLLRHARAAWARSPGKRS